MKDIKVELTKIKNYQYEGKIPGHMLSSEVLHLLGYNETMVALGLEVTIFGEYVVEYSSSGDMAQILDAALEGKDDSWIPFSLDHIDLDHLSDTIGTEDGQNWSADREANLADKALDRAQGE